MFRRRKESEDKAKVVAAVCGQKLFNSLPRQLFCLGLFERKGRIHPIFPNRPRQNSQRGKKFNKFCPPNRRPLPCLLILSVFYGLLGTFLPLSPKTKGSMTKRPMDKNVLRDKTSYMTKQPTDITSYRQNVMGGKIYQGFRN